MPQRKRRKIDSDAEKIARLKKENEELSAKLRNSQEAVKFQNIMLNFENEVQAIWKLDKDKSKSIITLNVHDMVTKTEKSVSEKLEALKRSLDQLPDDVVESTGKSREELERSFCEVQKEANDTLSNCAKLAKQNRLNFVKVYSSVTALIAVSPITWCQGIIVGSIVGAVMSCLLYLALRLCGESVSEIWEDVKPLLSGCWTIASSDAFKAVLHTVYEKITKKPVPDPVKKLLVQLEEVVDYYSKQEDPIKMASKCKPV